MTISIVTFRDKGVSYEFKDAYRLLADFCVEVDRVLKEMKL